MKHNPRFYQIRVVYSKHEMDTYVVLVHDIDRSRNRLGVEFYCIFSNVDEAKRAVPDAGDGFIKELQEAGQSATELEGSQPFEQQLLSDTIKQGYKDPLQVALRKVRP